MQRISEVNVSGASSRTVEESSGCAFRISRSPRANWSSSTAFCSSCVIDWNLWYGSKSGCAITTGSVPSDTSWYRFQITREQTIGPKSASTVPASAAKRAFPFQEAANRPSENATMSPNTDRDEAHTHSEPPRVPVNSYHCTRDGVAAKAFPSTSHGHEISATVR